MSDVKKLSDVLKAAPSLSEVGGFIPLMVDINGELAKMSPTALTGLTVSVTNNGSYLAKDTGVYLLVAFSKDNPWSEYWIGILINQKRDAKGCQHLIRVASNALGMEYNQWGTVLAKNNTSNVVHALIKLHSTPEIMGGGKWLTSKQIKIPLPRHLRHTARLFKHYELN